MAVTSRGEIIRRQIIRDVKHHPGDIGSHISQIFSISRQAVNKHLKILVDGEWLEASGSTRNRTYKLGPRRKNTASFSLSSGTSEHEFYNKEFAWVFDGVPQNIEDIVFYGFTEMVNNVIDHSDGNTCSVYAEIDKTKLKIYIDDDGEGIFKRISRLKELTDERQALLELYKGKLTTDPENHSGQGIFFTSRMFDEFTIYSHDLIFNHDHNRHLDLLLDDVVGTPEQGTSVMMELSLSSKRTSLEIFEQFSGGEDEDYAFNKTVIPVAMARFGKENLVSRSQAKRLLARIENFQYVLFDFEKVDLIGQAFADEIFRVYQLKNPQINLGHINTNEAINMMIMKALSDLKS